MNKLPGEAKASPVFLFEFMAQFFSGLNTRNPN